MEKTFCLNGVMPALYYKKIAPAIDVNGVRSVGLICGSKVFDDGPIVFLHRMADAMPEILCV